MVWMRRIRQLHRWVAPFVVLPLLVSVTTGVAYRLAKDWGGLQRDQVHWLMTLHEGEWLGPQLEPVVVLLNGLGLLWMLITGTSLAWQHWRTPRKSLSDPGNTRG
ncbi:MAG: PepSY domain-containing protein [Synechococcus sp.]|nr:PepSY domain-containing protein [Synechococcus sp.]